MVAAQLSSSVISASNQPPNLSFFCKRSLADYCFKQLPISVESVDECLCWPTWMIKCVMGRPPVSVGLFHLSVTDLLSKSTIPWRRIVIGENWTPTRLPRLAWRLVRGLRLHWLRLKLRFSAADNILGWQGEPKDCLKWKLGNNLCFVTGALPTCTGGDSPSLLIAYTSNLRGALAQLFATDVQLWFSIILSILIKPVEVAWLQVLDSRRTCWRGHLEHSFDDLQKMIF